MAGIKSIPWWRRYALPWYRFRVVLTVDAADEIPQVLPQRSAILVAESGQPKWLAFACPCKRGHTVMLNVDQRRRPYWKFTSDRRLTLSPSVNDFNIDQNCHYFVRNGRVEWVPYTNSYRDGGDYGEISDK